MKSHVLGTLSYDQLIGFAADIEEAQRRNDARLTVFLQKQHISYLVLVEFIATHGRDLNARPASVDELLADTMEQQLKVYSHLNHPLSDLVRSEREELIAQAERAGMFFSGGNLIVYSCPPEMVKGVMK